MIKLEEQDPNTVQRGSLKFSVQLLRAASVAIYDEKKETLVQTSLDAYFKVKVKFILHTKTNI